MKESIPVTFMPIVSCCLVIEGFLRLLVQGKVEKRFWLEVNNVRNSISKSRQYYSKKVCPVEFHSLKRTCRPHLANHGLRGWKTPMSSLHLERSLRKGQSPTFLSRSRWLGTNRTPSFQEAMLMSITLCGTLSQDTQYFVMENRIGMKIIKYLIQKSWFVSLSMIK